MYYQYIINTRMKYFQLRAKNKKLKNSLSELTVHAQQLSEVTARIVARNYVLRQLLLDIVEQRKELEEEIEKLKRDI